MATLALEPCLDPLRDCVQEWTDEQLAIEADLEESLAALEAFQRSLDSWHAELADERARLEQDRSVLEQERSDWTANHAENGELSEQITGLREQIEQLQQEKTELSQQLASEKQQLTEQIESQQIELTEKLEKSHAATDTLLTERDEARKQRDELTAELEAQRTSRAEEQERWNDEFKRMRELLERQAEWDEAELTSLATTPQPTSAATAPEDPVLGSVLEQFGKLRKQQASRQSRTNRG